MLGGLIDVCASGYTVHWRREAKIVPTAWVPGQSLPDHDEVSSNCARLQHQCAFCGDDDFTLINVFVIVTLAPVQRYTQLLRADLKPSFSKASQALVCIYLLLQTSTGFPRGIKSIKKVLNFKIGFQDIEKALNLAKMYIRYWISMEILNGKEIRSFWAELNWRQSTSLFMQYVKLSFMIKNFENWR